MSPNRTKRLDEDWIRRTPEQFAGIGSLENVAAACILARAGLRNQCYESERRFNLPFGILSEDDECSLPSKRL